MLSDFVRDTPSCNLFLYGMAAMIIVTFLPQFLREIHNRWCPAVKAHLPVHYNKTRSVSGVTPSAFGTVRKRRSARVVFENGVARIQRYYIKDQEQQRRMRSISAPELQHGDRYESLTHGNDTTDHNERSSSDACLMV